MLCSRMEVSWLSPAVASSPGHSCPPWQLSSGFLTRLFLGLSLQLVAGRERLSWQVFVEGSEVSLCHLLHFCGTKELGYVCVERGAGRNGAPGVQAAQLSPCHRGLSQACVLGLCPCIWGQGCLIPHCCAGLLITQGQGLASTMFLR